MIPSHQARDPLDPKVPLLDHVTMSNQFSIFRGQNTCPKKSSTPWSFAERTTGQLEQLEQLGRPAFSAAHQPMNLLEKVGHFISKRGDYIQEQISGKRVFSAHVTNATDEAGIAIGIHRGGGQKK